MVTVVCTYCGSRWHIEDDHVRPSNKGGVKKVSSCRACNRSKGASNLAEWLDRIKKEDSYRWRRIKKYQKYKRFPFAQMIRKRI